MKPEFLLSQIGPTGWRALLGSLLAGVSLSANVHASQWTLSQFSIQDPILTFESGSTLTPTINGIHFTPYPTEECGFTYGYGFGAQMLANTESVTYSYLDISFDQPQQAVGGYINNITWSKNVTNVTEIVFDKDGNVIDSATVRVNFSSNSQKPSTPVFLGLGEATTNIYKVEWRYGSPGFFGVDNVIYQPGPQIVLSNAPSSAGQISFTFQTFPGHTNVVQVRTNLAIDDWTSLTNLSFLGMGEVRQISIPMTNSSAAYFRVQSQ